MYQSPDGLASAGGRLYLCCEGSGDILSFDSTFAEKIEFSGVASPEGICVTPAGILVVTEDTVFGRIIMADKGETSVLAGGLGCPEGVAADPSGSIWFTTGGFEAGEIFTSLWMITENGAERIYSLPSVFSFSDLEISSSGTVYVCSESSGIFGDVSVFSYSPESDVFAPFVTGVPACEGICLTNGDFPMYLVSEQGAVFVADSTGTAVLFVETEGTPEDAVLFNGQLIVSDDLSSTLLRFEPYGP